MAETTNTNETENAAGSDGRFLGLLARFEDPHALVEGCDQARQAGYTKMDAFSPFPVHGIDDAIGIRRTRLPVMVFCVALFACGLGIFLQWYTNAFHHNGLFPGYDFKISGKPMFSLPANIPVIFEIIVLLSAFTAFFGMWALNGLPKLSNPLFRHPEFRRSTADGFFLFVEQADSNFDQERTRQQLLDWGADLVDPIHSPDEELQVPGYFKLVILILISLALVPPVVVYREQFGKNELPRMHFNPDMDRQYRSEAQDASPPQGGEGTLFADKRAMRPDPAGTIARGELARLTDKEFYAGIRNGTPDRAQALAELAKKGPLVSMDPELDWLTEFPSRIRTQLESKESANRLFERGRERFDVYCAACHGYSGDGNGLVSRRGIAIKLADSQKSAWIAAKSLHDPAVVKQPVGKIFDTITYGRAGMAPYRSQITAEDRWAIVLFVKALQLSRFGEQKDIPEGASVVPWDQVDPNRDPVGDTDDSGKSADGKPAKASGNPEDGGKAPGGK